jgi:dTDP-4-amino-4,6-dideoxygalactose transaminase
MEFIDLQAQRARLSPQIEDAIARVLEHGKFVSGPEVAELEERLADVAGVRHCVSCANGTDALVLALKASGLKSGQGVVVPSFTFAATAEAVVLAGGLPVFADIDPITFNLEPQSAAGARKEAEAAGIDVAGVMPVDLFGQPAPYEALQEALPELWFVADAAQSFGASVGDTRVGALASVTTTSFFPAKPLGCYGDGGAIFTDDNEIAEVLRSLRVHGQGSDKYDNVRVGTNSRLDTIQAAILLVKLDAFPAELLERQRVADRYRELLVGSPVQTPIALEGYRSAWAQYTIRTGGRDAVAARLKSAGVPTAVYYRQPLHRSSAYATFGAGSVLEETDVAAHEVLSLPMYPDMTDSLVEAVVETLLSTTGQA